MATLSQESAAVSNSLNVSNVSKELGHDEEITSVLLTILGDATYSSDVVPDHYEVYLMVDGEEIDSVSETLSQADSTVSYELQGDILNTSLTSSELQPDAENDVSRTISISVRFELYYAESMIGESLVSTDATMNLEQETITTGITQSANGSISLKSE